ncbi:MAG TPA: thiamine pyrophosphate-dependent enzyme [Chitinispirillaceae bacterium]|nr:thiamine pyrophosphate-dependent enzyme [Chitinispirillaceae bacterium]
MSKEQFYPIAYYYMYLSRQMEEKYKELFSKGYIKGTVILSIGNEATTVGMTLPFRPGKDIIALGHRDFSAHLVAGASPLSLLCQYLANEKSPTCGKEGNVHHGDVQMRRFPFMSHLGSMLAPAVGGTWAARKEGDEVFGLATIGDGGSSTGDFHESLNLASVMRVPVLFIVENNHYAYSTPVEYQYNCSKLSDRALGYGIEGKTIDGTDVWEVYNAVCDALEAMSADQLPRLIECMTLRLEGHAVYDKAEYVPRELLSKWREKDPIVKARSSLNKCGFSEEDICNFEHQITQEVNEMILKALQFKRPDPHNTSFKVYAERTVERVKPFKSSNLRNLNAIQSALDYLLSENTNAFLIGQDVGVYGSAFKTCKGLYDKYPGRVIDSPVCESATTGFCLGASQTGSLPIMEFQFADFSTEAVTQLGLNTATWFFRSDATAQVLFRMPSGGGITMGAFHSGEYDGLWSRFPGLKLFFPVTPQETFEAIVAGFYDPNPCMVFEHKMLYWGRQGNIDFSGDLNSVYMPRRYTEGSKLTIVAFGAMVEAAVSIVNNQKYSAEVWNPFILNPIELGPVIDSVRSTGRLLVIQESGYTAGSGDRIISIICKECFNSLKCAPVLISAPDSPVPFAKELEIFYLPTQSRIVKAIESMIGEECE